MIDIHIIKIDRISWQYINTIYHYYDVSHKHGFEAHFLLVVYTSRSFPYSWLINGFVTRLTRRVPLVEQELPTLPEHMSSPPDFNRVRHTRSLVLCVCIVDHWLSFGHFSLGHCVVCFFDLRILITPLVSSNSSSYFKC